MLQGVKKKRNIQLNNIFKNSFYCSFSIFATPIKGYLPSGVNLVSYCWVQYLQRCKSAIIIEFTQPEGIRKKLIEVFPFINLNNFYADISICIAAKSSWFPRKLLDFRIFSLLLARRWNLPDF